MLSCRVLSSVIKSLNYAQNILKENCIVKKMPNTVENIKQKIMELKGQEVNLYINRGRRKVSSLRATIENVYASVFTVNSIGEKNVYTYSYNDILCGEVKITND